MTKGPDMPGLLAHAATSVRTAATNMALAAQRPL
jgi:hypothetical protein